MKGEIQIGEALSTDLSIVLADAWCRADLRANGNPYAPLPGIETGSRITFWGSAAFGTYSHSALIRTFSGSTFTSSSFPPIRTLIQILCLHKRTIAPGILCTLQPLRIDRPGERSQITQSPGFTIRIPDGSRHSPPLAAATPPACELGAPYWRVVPPHP
jgi:hypothetical protein